MAHWARVKGGIVTQVIIAEEEYFQTYIDDEPGEWLQTSYNTRAGQHDLGGTPLRKNFAGVGYVYDSTRDAFYPPQPYASWILDESTCLWEPPVAYPTDDKMYQWNETDQAWNEV
tara:strand:- start:215 stop:559 length:345 start_codon:yes stop_codon:yes gene_type:complete